jgi:hypothetical protein
MEGYSHRILEILSPYFRTGWQEIKNKPQPSNKFQILDLRKTKQDSPLDHDFQRNAVSTEVASFLPVAVDEDGPAGPNDYGRQSRQRLLFVSGPT